MIFPGDIMVVAMLRPCMSPDMDAAVFVQVQVSTNSSIHLIKVYFLRVATYLPQVLEPEDRRHLSSVQWGSCLPGAHAKTVS